MMKKNRFSLACCLTTMLIAGCSSFGGSSASDAVQTLSGGERIANNVHLFWVTQNKGAVTQAEDYVVTADGHGYTTTYKWVDGAVREVIRQGEKQNNDEVVPFETLLRFDAHGDAIYQRYRVDGKVFPLSQQQTEQYQQQARNVLKVTTDEHEQGLRLIQGYWNGQTFTSCDGQQYPAITFNHTVRGGLAERLESSDNYMAFIGTSSADAVRIHNMLLLEDHDHQCLTATKSADD